MKNSASALHVPDVLDITDAQRFLAMLRSRPDSEIVVGTIQASERHAIRRQQGLTEAMRRLLNGLLPDTSIGRLHLTGPNRLRLSEASSPAAMAPERCVTELQRCAKLLPLEIDLSTIGLSFDDLCAHANSRLKLSASIIHCSPNSDDRMTCILGYSAEVVLRALIQRMNAEVVDPDDHQIRICDTQTVPCPDPYSFTQTPDRSYKLMKDRAAEGEIDILAETGSMKGGDRGVFVFETTIAFAYFKDKIMDNLRIFKPLMEALQKNGQSAAIFHILLPLHGKHAYNVSGMDGEPGSHVLSLPLHRQVRDLAGKIAEKIDPEALKNLDRRR